MKIYMVGGAVRDELLGFSVKDKDFVVVGSTPAAMISAGFKPVGKDFPVFLHPKTHDEYALARTERKSGSGYKGFVVHAAADVTLEEDLARRDLTVNAIAKTDDGQLIDPYNGLADIEAKTLRHISDAFAEDPVRILRTARFAARYPDFSIAPETKQLMQMMVKAGEVDALVAERVWQELAKGLMEIMPSRMFDALRACGALQKILPELDKLWGIPQPVLHHPEIDTGVHIMMVIDYTAKQSFSLPVRFAALMHDLGKGTTPTDALPRHIGHELRGVSLLKDIAKRLRVPNDCKELAQIVTKFHGKLHQVHQMRPNTLLEFLIELDAVRQPNRFKDFLKACEADSRGRTGHGNCALSESDLMLKVLDAASSIDAGEVASKFSESEKIKVAIFEARLTAVKQVL
ncbi:MAG: multifunctional CCA addition/repair protein [Methylotenera sp.]|nr:multifunctional CCA addition/repair protein [Methylotenera sp.]